MQNTLTATGLALLVLACAGCGGSSHTIYTTGGKTTASFNNKKVKDVVDVLTKSFAPLKGYTAEIPDDLKDFQITMSFEDVSTIEPVKKVLEEATGYTVEVDTTNKKIKFVKK